MNDDYGDHLISQSFFKHQIPTRQRQIAQECRDRISREGLAYADLAKLTLLPNRTVEQLRWSTNIAKSIETQWVVGAAGVALQSFLDINQRAVQIDPTERYMIENNEAPTVISARAIVSSARGHQYWGRFDDVHIKTIEKKASLVFNAIFEPEDARPHTDTALQPAGLAHTANGLRIALDLVNIVNGVLKDAASDDAKDQDGSKTARCIEKTYGVVKYMAGKDSASMSLHPAVYFWGLKGNHRPSIFLAVALMIQEMIAQDELVKFTLCRAKFEKFLVRNSGIGKEILGKHGGWKKSVGPVKTMLRTMLDGLSNRKSETDIEKEILGVDSKRPTTADYELQQGRDSWRETKSALRIRTSLETAPRCSICKARLVISDASDDHINRRVDGGASTVENAQLTHRYCNHGFKEHHVQRGLQTPEIQFLP